MAVLLRRNDGADGIAQQIELLQILIESQLNDYEVKDVGVTIEAMTEWIENDRLNELGWLLGWDSAKMPFDYFEVTGAQAGRDFDFEPNQRYHLCSDGFGNTRALEVCKLLDYLSAFQRIAKSEVDSEKRTQYLNDIMFSVLAVVARPERDRAECNRLDYQFDRREPFNRYEHVAFMHQRRRLFQQHLSPNFAAPLFQALSIQFADWSKRYAIFSIGSDSESEEQDGAMNLKFGKAVKRQSWTDVLNAFAEHRPAERAHIFNLVNTDFFTMLHQQHDERRRAAENAQPTA